MSFGVGAFPFGLFQTTFTTNNHNNNFTYAPRNLNNIYYSIPLKISAFCSFSTTWYTWTLSTWTVITCLSRYCTSCHIVHYFELIIDYSTLKIIKNEHHIHKHITLFIYVFLSLSLSLSHKCKAKNKRNTRNSIQNSLIFRLFSFCKCKTKKINIKIYLIILLLDSFLFFFLSYQVTKYILNIYLVIIMFEIEIT